MFKTPEVPLLNLNDTLPSGVSEEEVAYYGAFVLCAGISILSVDLAPVRFGDTGNAYSLQGFEPTIYGSGNGWVGTDTVLIRLDDIFVPNATFPVWSAEQPVNIFGHLNHIGYDAAVCVKMYEPWIVQIYNSSLGVPKTMTIVGKSASTDFETDDGNRGPRLNSYTRALNSTGKESAYSLRYARCFSLERY